MALKDAQATRRGFLVGVGATAGAVLLPAVPAWADPGGVSSAQAAGHGPEVAARWVRASYDVVVAEGLTPPTAARAYALVAVAIWESLQGGLPHHVSLTGQLTGLTSMPRPAAPGLVDWPLVVTAAAAGTLRGLFPQASAAGKAAVDDAERAERDSRRREGVSDTRAQASEQHGAKVARAILDWAAGDGHAAASTKSYAPPTGEGLWVPTPPNFGTAIEPHCDEVRPMILRSTDEVAPALPVPFSSAPGSDFWLQAEATYQQSRDNTDEQRDIARFWTDNPRFSGLPAGHWMSIVVQVAEQHGLRLDATAEALVRAAVAMNDAFLNCWTWKYRYNVLRPVTYVRRYRDATWSTWVNTPQFPEHTSGHSVASRAASTVLTELLGERRFDDTSRATTAGIARRTRTFSSFTDAADSAAISRIYGGIHFPHGIETGKAQGDRVGALVVARLRTRTR